MFPRKFDRPVLADIWQDFEGLGRILAGFEDLAGFVQEHCLIPVLFGQDFGGILSEIACKHLLNLFHIFKFVIVSEPEEDNSFLGKIY